MKLIYCNKCSDVISLSPSEKTCGCRSSGGRYINQNEAEYWGDCVPFAIDNYSFFARARHTETVNKIYDQMHGEGKIQCWILEEGAPNFETIKRIKSQSGVKKRNTRKLDKCDYDSRNNRTTRSTEGS